MPTPPGTTAPTCSTIRWLQDRDGELTDLARDIATSSMLVVPEFAYRAGAATIAARAGLGATRPPRSWRRCGASGSPCSLDGRARG